MRVAIVIMPFAGSERPSLAAGLLKAGLRQRGVACDCKYFNLTFCKMIGTETYRRLSDRAQTTILAGEWIFSQLYFGTSFSSWETYRSEILEHPVQGVGRGYRQAIEKAREVAPAFLRLTFAACDWSAYDLVGFSSVFEQTMASLCLAKLIREQHPQVKIAFGGANFEQPMGRAYLNHFPEIDFVASGEADVSFPQLCENLAHGKAEVPPGILHRQGAAESEAADAAAPVALDHLPLPDFDDFFPAFAQTFPKTEAMLPFETSRGCWWGQKRHCTFCGLNGGAMAFRRKSWRRVVLEIEALERRYSPAALFFADNILAMDYFKTLLPHWVDTRHATRKNFEIKANLRRDQVVMLKRAGISDVQPGIESFSDPTLQLMDKGVTAVQNIALLRWCEELGIRASWNVIFGFPGEDLEDYPRQLALLEKLTHLSPPVGCAPIRMDRFSPNFERWQDKGFTAVSPCRAYRHVFPMAEDELRQAAYYFDYEHPHSSRIVELSKEIVQLGFHWRRNAGQDGRRTSLFEVRRHLDGGWVLLDRRFNRTKANHRLGPVELMLLGLADTPTTRKALSGKASLLNGGDQSWQDAYARLLAADAMVEIGDQLVALPLLPEEARQDLSELIPTRKETADE